MHVRETIRKIAGGVLAPGTRSGMRRLNPELEGVCSESLAVSSFVLLERGGDGSNNIKSMAPKRQAAANKAAVRYSLKKTEPSKGPAINASPTAIPSFPTLPALSAADADSSWYSIKRAFKTVKFCWNNADGIMLIQRSLIEVARYDIIKSSADAATPIMRKNRLAPPILSRAVESEDFPIIVEPTNVKVDLADVIVPMH